MRIGEKIKQLRESKDIQQKRMAIELEVGQATISQWESGRQEPSPSQRKKIAEYFGIKEWELFADTNIQNLKSKEFELSKAPLLKIPVISWVSANSWSPADDPFPMGVSDEFIYTTTKGGDNMYGLKVSQSCMEPEFREGDIIVIDPSAQPENGDFVIVRDNESDHATFKQLKKYGDKIILHPLNPKYKDIELEESERYEIIGKVVEKVKKY